MARSVYEHLLRLTGDNSGLVRAADGSTSAIKRLDESSRRGQASLDRYNSSLQTSTRATTAFARAFGGISVGLVAREFIQAADSMTLLEGRLKLVTDNTNDLISTQRTLFSVAQDSRASLEATTSFYVRLAQRLGETTTGTLALAEVTELVSKSLKIGGATAKETTSSLLQLSQALSSGLLRGDEFRSLSENAVGLMQNIADGAGTTQAELRRLSIEGKLTTEFILDALANSAPEIRRQFNQIPVTFGDAVQRLQNIAVQGVADFNKEFDITGKLVTGIELLGNNVDDLATIFTSLVAIKVGRSFQSIAEGIAASRAQTALETAAIKNNERAVIAETTAKVNKAKVEQAALLRQKQIIVESAREAAAKLNLAKTEGARAIQLTRLAALDKQQLALKTALTAATGKLVAAESASAAAKRSLAVSTGLLSGSLATLNKGVAFLGGPIGLLLLATQAAFMFDVFGDGEKTTTLSQKSLDRLGESTRSLTGLTFEQLEAERQSVDAKIKQIETDDLQTESSLQKLEVFKQLKDAIEDNILLTREGAKAAVEESIASATALSQRVAAAKAAAEANNSFFGTLQVSEQLLKAEKIAADNVLEAYENYEKVLARLNGQTTDISRENLIKGFQEEASKVAGLRAELARLIKLQKEVITTDELNADGKKALSDRIKKLTTEIEGRNKKSNNQLSIVEKLEKKERDLRKEIVQLSAAHENSGKEVSKFSVELEKKRKELDKHLGILPDVKAEIEKLTDKYQSGEISIKEYEAALKKLKLSQSEFEAVMRESGATYDKVEAALKQLTQSQEDQLTIQRIAATEGETAAEVYEQLTKIAKEYGRTVEEIKERYPEVVEAQARFIEQREGIEAVNEAIEDFSTSLADAIVEGEDLGEFFKNLWKQMVKDFLASGITKLIGSLVSGNGFDFSGFTSGIGGAGGGSVLGGLFGNVLGVGSSGGTNTGGSNPIIETAGSALGLTPAQTNTVISGASSLVGLWAGWQQIANGNEAAGALQVASSGISGFNAVQSLRGGQQLSGGLTTGIGLAGNVLGVINGIQQGGLEGYGSAAFNGYQGYQALQSLGLIGGGQAAANAAAIAQTNALASGFGNTASQVAGSAFDLSLGGSQAATQAANQTASQVGNTFGQSVGQAIGVAAGAYNIYSGLQRGNSAGYTQAAGGAITAASSLGYLSALGPYGAAIGAIISILAAGRGSRPYEQILQEDYLPDVFGVNAGSGIGVGGALGFAGGNAAIFGANYGIRGTGITEQFSANGGENGNYAFFTGAQRSLDSFEEALRAAGISDVRNVAGTLSVTSSTTTVEQIREIWQAYADGIETAVSASEVFQTAVENGLIGMDSHAKLFLENFAVGFGESAFEARESLLSIDRRFDELTTNGLDSTEALFQSISEHYGIAVDDAQFFVEQSGVSIEQWVNNFSTASEEALSELLDFNQDGLTSFETTFNTIDGIGKETVGAVGNRFTGLGDILRGESRDMLRAYELAYDGIEAASDITSGLVTQDFTVLTTAIESQAESAVIAYRDSLQSLDGALDGVDLGTPTAGSPTITVNTQSQGQTGRNGSSRKTLGSFASALGGSETIPVGGNSLGTSADQLYSIGVNTRESVTVNKKGMIERIEAKVDQNNGGMAELVYEVRQLVAELRSQTQELEFIRGSNHDNFN